MWLDRFRSSQEQKPAAQMTTLQQVRSTRFHLDLPVAFVADGRSYDGQSVNVSESGLLARCDELPELWTDGQLFLEAGEHYLNINARVARVQNNDVGFAFAVTTENDRAALSVLIQSVSDHPVESEELLA